MKFGVVTLATFVTNIQAEAGNLFPDLEKHRNLAHLAHYSDLVIFEYFHQLPFLNGTRASDAQ